MMNDELKGKSLLIHHSSFPHGRPSKMSSMLPPRERAAFSRRRLCRSLTRSARRNLPTGLPVEETLVELRIPVPDREGVIAEVATLAARLTELKRADPNVAVVIRPDRELPVQKLVNLMDALQRAQITKVGIATKAEPKQ